MVFCLSLLPAEEMRDEEVHTIPPELQILLDLDHPPIRGGAGRNGGFPFPFPGISRRVQKEGGADGVPQPKDPTIPSIQLFPGLREPEEAQGNREVALSVKCDSEKMMVAVEKGSVQVSAVGFLEGIREACLSAHLTPLCIRSFHLALSLLNSGDLILFSQLVGLTSSWL